MKMNTDATYLFRFCKPERSVSGDVIYVLMEVRSETDYVVHHAKKVLGIFAAMRGFSSALQAAGFKVHLYVQIQRTPNSSTSQLVPWIQKSGFSSQRFTFI
jgi:deoxyribodipyrimidine photolyase-related protein